MKELKKKEIKRNIVNLITTFLFALFISLFINAIFGAIFQDNNWFNINNYYIYIITIISFFLSYLFIKIFCVDKYNNEWIRNIIVLTIVVTIKMLIDIFFSYFYNYEFNIILDLAILFSLNHIFYLLYDKFIIKYNCDIE